MVMKKSTRIKKEYKRLCDAFAGIDEAKLKVVLPLVERAAFLRVEMEDLEAHLQVNGWTSEYQNGENQWGTKRSPENDTYNSLIKAYTTITSKLTDLAKASPKADDLAEFLKDG